MSEAAHAEHAHDHDHGHGEALPGTIGHVTSVGTLIKVILSLLVLTVITVAIAQVDLGKFNIVGAVGVACIKATIVSLWFMHLRYDKRFNFWIFAASMMFVAWMIGYILFDTALYQHNIREYKQDKAAPATP